MLKSLNAGTAKKAAGTFYVCPKCRNTFDAPNLTPESDFCGRKVASFIKIG